MKEATYLVVDRDFHGDRVDHGRTCYRKASQGSKYPIITNKKECNTKNLKVQIIIFSGQINIAK